MKKRKFADGGETTEMMPSAKPEGGRFDEDTYSRARRFVESGGNKESTSTAVKKARKVESAPAPKASAPTPTPKTEPAPQRIEVVGKKPSKDDTSMSLSERMKASRERARTGGSGTDTRSVSERIKGALGFSKGGSVGSASRRADGIAAKGKTKCRIV